MAAYTKQTNPELVALLKERGLPHSGKKADLIKRLEEHDASQSATAAPTTVPAPAATAKPAIEDEIDWDDDTAGATTEQAASAVAAGGVGEVKNPVDVPNQEVAEDPATTNDLTVAGNTTAVAETVEDAPAAAVEEKEKSPEKDFTSGLAERTIDEEIEKRKARARKFGMPEDSEEIKMLIRAKKFGVTDASAVPGMLNQALSAPGKGDRKRGPAGLDGALSEGGVHKRGRRDGGRGRGRDRPGMGRRQASGRPSPAPGAKKEGGGYASWMGEEDRRKADARKAKFATTG